jgi:hypothetical protein
LGAFFEGTTNFLDFEAGLDTTNVRFLGLLLLNDFTDIVSSISDLFKDAFLSERRLLGVVI